MNLFRQIEGKNVSDIFLDEESLTLVMDDYSLVIYNKFVLENECIITSLINCVISKIEFINDLNITFDNKCLLKVKLDNDSYVSPESVILYYSGNPIVIMN